MGRRKPNGASSIYQGKDGYWHGRVTVGVKDNGQPDRRHVQGKTEADVTKKVRKLEREREAGTVRKTGQRWTVEKWLVHWLDNIAAPVVRVNTFDGYRVAIRKHLIPGVGGHRLDLLQPEHLEKLYARMLANGSAPATAHQSHRTIRTALNEAVRRGHLGRNPASLAKPPRLPDSEVEPFSIEEVQTILKVAGKRRNSARWAVALALGLRQGEALGMKWPDVNLSAGTLTVRRALLRPKWGHGCDPKCDARVPGLCADRVNLRPVSADTKSRAGRRTIGLPDALIRCSVSTERPRRRSGRKPRSSGRTRTGCSRRRLAGAFTRRPTTTIGSVSFEKPECATPGCMTPATRPRRRFWSSASPAAR